MQKLLKASTMERVADSSCFPTLIQLERDTGRKTIVENNMITEEVLLRHLRWVGDNRNGGSKNDKGYVSNDGTTDQPIFQDRRGQRLEIVQYILKTIDKEVQNLFYKRYVLGK